MMRILSKTQREEIIADADSRCQQCGAMRGKLGISDLRGKWWAEEDIHGLNSDFGYDTFGTYDPYPALTILYVNEPTPGTYTVLCSACHCKAYPERYAARAQKAVQTKQRKKRQAYEESTGQVPMFED